jgi:RimJ/RimL family protein N-acetyltransferase
VSLEQHLSWLESTLSREDRVLLIGELANGIPVGVVRFDIDCNNAQAEISITIAPPAQGKGYAAPLLRGAISTLNQDEKKRIAILTLIAKVRHDNVPSISCFMRVGFQFTREDAEFKYLSRSLHQG